MGWHIVQKLVEGVGEHSTLIGKLWITSFFIIRFLLVVSIAKSTWSDAQGAFVCNTKSPGCKNVCFNEFSPIAPIRYWFFQILAVGIMSIIFIVYTKHKIALVHHAIGHKRKWEHKKREKKRELREKQKHDLMVASVGEEEAKALKLKDTVKKIEVAKQNDDDGIATKLTEDSPSKLFLAYFFMVFARLAMEIGFMVGQYYIYTFKFVVPELFQCQHWPCPNVVDCFISRPKEKTIMVCAFYATGCVMVVLNLFELYHLTENFAEAWKTRHQDITKEVFGDEEGPTFHGAGRNVGGWGPGMEGAYEMYPSGFPDAVGIPTAYSKYRRSRGRKMKSGLNRDRYEYE